MSPPRATRLSPLPGPAQEPPSGSVWGESGCPHSCPGSAGPQGRDSLSEGSLGGTRGSGVHTSASGRLETGTGLRGDGLGPLSHMGPAWTGCARGSAGPATWDGGSVGSAQRCPQAQCQVGMTEPMPVAVPPNAGCPQSSTGQWRWPLPPFSTGQDCGEEGGCHLAGDVCGTGTGTGIIGIRGGIGSSTGTGVQALRLREARGPCLPSVPTPALQTKAFPAPGAGAVPWPLCQAPLPPARLRGAARTWEGPALPAQDPPSSRPTGLARTRLPTGLEQGARPRPRRPVPGGSPSARREPGWRWAEGRGRPAGAVSAPGPGGQQGPVADCPDPRGFRVFVVGDPLFI